MCINDREVTANEEEKKMAVSKATIGCIKKEHSKQFLDHIKKTEIKTDVLYECHQLMKNLIESKENNK